MRPWMLFFKAVLDMIKIPPAIGTTTTITDEIESRDKEPLWRLKAMAAHTTYLLFTRYADTRTVAEVDKQFSLKLV